MTRSRRKRWRVSAKNAVFISKKTSVAVDNDIVVKNRSLHRSRNREGLPFDRFGLNACNLATKGIQS